MTIPKTAILLCAIAGLFAGGCSRKSGEEKTAARTDSTAAQAGDTALAAERARP